MRLNPVKRKAEEAAASCVIYPANDGAVRAAMQISPNPAGTLRDSGEGHFMKVSVYLNFTDRTEEAFGFYKSIFGTEYAREPARYGDMPGVADEFRNLILNVQLPIADGYLLMGSDVPEGVGMGGELKMGNNVQICLHPDTREDADRLYAALAEGGNAHMPLADQFWGDYYGELIDKFGINWLVAHTPSA